MPKPQNARSGKSSLWAAWIRFRRRSRSWNRSLSAWGAEALRWLRPERRLAVVDPHPHRRHDHQDGLQVQIRENLEEAQRRIEAVKRQLRVLGRRPLAQSTSSRA